jgi:hypothetical protein
MIHGLKQQMGQMQQELQKANAGIPAKQLEVDGRLKQSEMDIASKERLEMAKIQSAERIAALDNETKLLIAGMNIDVQKAKVIAEVDRTLVDQAQATHQHATDTAHEIGMAHLAHAQELEKLDKSHEQNLDIAAQSAQTEPQS